MSQDRVLLGYEWIMGSALSNLSLTLILDLKRIQALLTNNLQLVLTGFCLNVK
jgi:hypothetical protein